MKNVLLLSVLLCTVFLGCKKNKTTPFDYTLNGIDNITVEKEGTATMPVEIRHTQGNGEFVSMYISGLPKNVSVSINPDHATGSFNSGIVFNVNGMAAEGTYPLTLTAYSLTTYYRTYEFNLKIIPAKVPGVTGCIDGRIGTYLAKGTCTPDSYYVNVVKDPFLTNGIMVENFGNYSLYPVNLHVILDCATKNMSIPTQVEDSTGLQFSGIGVFDDNTITLNYDVVDGPKTSNCQVILKK